MCCAEGILVLYSNKVRTYRTYYDMHRTPPGCRDATQRNATDGLDWIGWMVGRIDGWIQMDGRMDGWEDGWMGGMNEGEDEGEDGWMGGVNE